VTLENRTQSSCELVVGDFRVLFSYADPVAFHMPGLGIYERLNEADTKATRNHKIAFRARDPNLVLVPAADFDSMLRYALHARLRK
jgi:hypothetical protein